MITQEHKIVDIVKESLGTADVFDKYNIDFCCGGDKPIEKACREKGVDSEQLVRELNEKLSMSDSETKFINNLNPAELCDYIEKRHHSYVTEAIPVIQQYLEKVCEAHGQSHPELFKVRDHFDTSAGQLSQHMKKEELILFPFIRKMQKAKAENQSIEKPHFGSVDNPISMMKEEHSNEGARFEEISSLTNNYEVPQDACNTFRVTYHKLKEFEDDLHRHIHLENNVLFPEAIRMQEEFFGKV